MANEVTGVVLTIDVKVPGSNIIKVEEVFRDGSGTLSEALQGGQSTFVLTLKGGKDLKPLHANEPVFVSGTRNGSAFRLPGPLETVKAHEPWTFRGTFGSTGP